MLPNFKLLIFVLCSGAVFGAKINTDGGYEISLAVNSDLEIHYDGYVANLKAVFRSFSNQLYRSTNGKFYIKSLDILIPSDWTLGESSLNATSESYNTADIRISDRVSVPYTENGNLCGEVGNFIELPLSFFNTSNESPYGSQAKVLVNQWARYRFGVWEEHGFPSSTNFPYFHKNHRTHIWETTGCSNSPLIGAIVDRHHEEDNPSCNPENEQLAPDCRFQPSLYKNHASSSLMHFHFLETVSKFCDASNHNALAPNKQNQFCSYRSIWEVVQGTADFKAVTVGNPMVPTVKFNLIKERSGPVLYVLLDRGQPQFPSIANKINTEISKLFDISDIRYSVSALGTYPDSNSVILERVGWAEISGNENRFQDAVRNTPMNGDMNRDFGAAIIAAVDLIKRRHPPGGGVLLVVKTGAGKESFGSITYEREVFGALAAQHIKVYGVELKGEASRPYLNLKTLIMAVSGDYTIINSTNVDSPSLWQDLLGRITTDLAGLTLQSDDETVIFKGIIPATIRQTIYVKPGLTRMNFGLTVPANADISLEITEGTTNEKSVPEWDEIVDGKRRKTMQGYFMPTEDIQLNGGIWLFKYTCNTNCVNVKGHLFVSGIYGFSISPIIEPEASVFTSAIGNMVDLNATKHLDSPFTIFAKIHHLHRPVFGFKVQAIITPILDATPSTIDLVDNGLGSPDADQHDGLYSGTFIPAANGVYKIQVQVRNEEIQDRDSDSDVERIDSRLIPVDQTEFGCNSEPDVDDCGPVGLKFLYEQAYDVLDTVTFTNRNLFVPGRPTTVRQISVPAISNGEIPLRFITPNLIGLKDSDPADLSYNIYIANELDHVLNHAEHDESLYEYKYVLGWAKPGEPEELKVQSAQFTGIVYIGFETVHKDLKSGMSTIVHTNYTADFLPTTADPAASTISEATEEYEDPTTVDPSASSSSRPEDDDGSSKSFWKKPGGIVTIVAIALVALLIVAGAVWYCKKRCSNSSDNSA